MKMTKDEFEQIIKPLSLIDNPKHHEFIRQVLVGNFNRWHESNFSNTHNEALRKQPVSVRIEQLSCIHNIERLRLIGGNITCLDCQSTWFRQSN